MVGVIITILFFLAICNYLIFSYSSVNIMGPIVKTILPWLGGIFILFFIGVLIRNEIKKSAPEREAKKLAEDEENRIKVEKMAELLKQQKKEVYFARLELRKEIEKMPKYNNWREKVFEKYWRKCEICGGVNNIEIHHRISFDKIIRRFNIKTKEQAFECDALWNIDNGSVLCHECHIKMESSKIRSSHN